MELDHLNYNITELQIIYRVQFTNTVSSDPAKRTYSWSKWWLYRKAGGRMVITPNTLDLEVIDILNDKIKKLKKRNPEAEYKIIKVYSTQHTEEIEYAGN